MDFRRALATYTVLTIGDGLVTVIPALMISVSGGLIVTRASSERKLGSEFRRQLFSNSEPLILASGVLVALAVFPGLPMIPFLLVGGALGTYGFRLRRKVATRDGETSAAAVKKAKSQKKTILIFVIDSILVILPN
jgi:flagellar biosynthesis protein FlhA